MKQITKYVRSSGASRLSRLLYTALFSIALMSASEYSDAGWFRVTSELEIATGENCIPEAQAGLTHDGVSIFENMTTSNVYPQSETEIDLTCEGEGCPPLFDSRAIFELVDTEWVHQWNEYELFTNVRGESFCQQIDRMCVIQNKRVEEITSPDGEQDIGYIHPADYVPTTDVDTVELEVEMTDCDRSNPTLVKRHNTYTTPSGYELYSATKPGNLAVYSRSNSEVPWDLITRGQGVKIGNEVRFWTEVPDVFSYVELGENLADPSEFALSLVEDQVEISVRLSSFQLDNNGVHPEDTFELSNLRYVYSTENAKVTPKVVSSERNEVYAEAEFSVTCTEELGAVNPLDCDGDGFLNIWELPYTAYSSDPGFEPRIRSAGVYWAGSSATSNDKADLLLVDVYDANPNIPKDYVAHLHKDIIVEVEYTQNAFNEPPGVMTDRLLMPVVDAFKKAPVTNPDNTSGINLHIINGGIVSSSWLGDDISKFSDIGFQGSAGGRRDFQAVKGGGSVNCARGGQGLGSLADTESPNCSDIITAKDRTFRYALFVDSVVGHPGASGIGEIGGDDFVVSLGNWPQKPLDIAGGLVAAQNATFMHELGHTLGLGHGGPAFDMQGNLLNGGDGYVNCKPNYQSVMNYLFQFDSLSKGRSLDYSRSQNQLLNEIRLDESKGTSLRDTYSILYGTTPGNNVKSDRLGRSKKASPIDWNNNNNMDSSAVVNLNWIPKYNCKDKYGAFVLLGGDDWQNLDYDFKDSPYYSLGSSPLEIPEQPDSLSSVVMTNIASTMDSDGDLLMSSVDNCPYRFNPDQADMDGDGIGNACDNCASLPNQRQIDTNDNGTGDLCEPIAEVCDVESANLTKSSTGGKWELLALPCQPPAGRSSVELVLGDDARGELGTDWAVFSYDSGGYRALGGEDLMTVGEAYWFIHTNSVTLNMPIGSTKVSGNNLNGCASSSGCVSVELPGAEFSWSLVGNPVATVSNLEASVSTLASGCNAQPCSLLEASEAEVLHDIFFTFDSSSSSYKPISEGS